MKPHLTFFSTAILTVFVLTGALAGASLASISKTAFEANTADAAARLAEIKTGVAKIPSANLTKRGELESKTQLVSDGVAGAAKVGAGGYSVHWRELKANLWSLEKTYYQVRRVDAERSAKKADAKAWRDKNTALSRQISTEDKARARLRGHKNQAGLLDNKAKQRSAGPPSGWDSMLAEYKKAYAKAKVPVADFLDAGFKDWAGKKAKAEAALAELDRAFDKIRSALR